MSIGSRIFQQRKALDITKTQLAENLGVSFQAVSSWERDEYLPETEKLIAIARALGVSVAFMMDDDVPQIPNWGMSDRVFSEERMFTFIKAAATIKGLTQTLKALPFSKASHKGQTRQAGSFTRMAVYSQKVSIPWAVCLPVNSTTLAAN